MNGKLNSLKETWQIKQKKTQKDRTTKLNIIYLFVIVSVYVL